MSEQMKMDDKALRKIVDEQAEDDGLWFKAETCAEAYVQQELRKLHAAVESHLTAIEGKTESRCPHCGGPLDSDGLSPHILPPPPREEK